MTDEDALLNAIAAHPEEDTPRLVYADWLDENTDALPDPNTARIRAEFIRLQIEIAHKQTLPREILNRHVDLFKRNQELLDNHRVELLAPFAEKVRYFDAIFERGFLTELKVEAELFLDHAEWIGKLKPLPRVKLAGIAATFDAFCGSESHWRYLHCVTSCQFQSDCWEERQLTAAEAELFFAMCSHFARLEKLDLTGCGIDDHGLEQLLVLTSSQPAKGQRMPKLTDVDLTSNDITDDGVRLLVGSELWRRLKRLSFGYNPAFTDESARLILAAASNSPLEDFSFRSPQLSQALAQSLRAQFSGRVDLF
ncbi:MAG: TIGR02996 domain-containing protein [Planctomycetia bacterium]|nr:TIGR02996 domain-containing protein [Planctomycetia bacterium]